MIKERGTLKVFLTAAFLFVFITSNLLSPHPAKAFSLQQILQPATSFLVTIGEKIQYAFAFTPASKVKVLESQAQRRLTNAQNQAQNNTGGAENLVKEYQDIKNKQNSFLDKVDDNTLKQIQEQTIEEQKTLAGIWSVAPSVENTIKTVNNNVVNEIKNTVVFKEGTTAAEAFNQKATIVYAPGTGPGGTATLVVEGQKFAPGTSAGGSAGTDIKNVVIEGGGGTGGGTTVSGNNPGVAPGTSGSGTGGTTVVGGNAGTAPGTSSGGTGGQTVVGE